MKEYPSLRHTRWDGKYPIVFIPKRRQKRIFGVLRQHLGKIFHRCRPWRAKRRPVVPGRRRRERAAGGA